MKIETIRQHFKISDDVRIKQVDGYDIKLGKKWSHLTNRGRDSWRRSKR